MTDSTTTPGLQMTRVFAAPRSLVFDAWAKEEHLLNWFGPRQWPVTSWTHDFRSGGSFEFVMQGPDGMQSPGAGDYEEIVDGEKIVVRSRIVADGELIFETRQVTTFADEGAGTRISIDVEVLVNKDFPGLAGMEQGWSETLDRLGEFVEA